LGDALKGDATLFAREDYVEEAWRIVDPVLKAGTPVSVYEPNTWGPGEVNRLVSPPEGWQDPIVTAPSPYPIPPGGARVGGGGRVGGGEKPHSVEDEP